jgi:hypothetical protein
MKQATETAPQALFRRMAEVAGRGLPLIDRALFWLLRKRLSRFVITGDSADALGDRVCVLIQMIQDEAERRNREVENWQRMARAAKSAQASRRQFVSSEVENSEVREKL